MDKFVKAVVADIMDAKDTLNKANDTFALVCYLLQNNTFNYLTLYLKFATILRA
ncbi:hypothetical protein [Desertibacillus haloalkaliphilus]|uniref:hypothetical protein n=1 Tax=Desertibacillus haloalkaliphilus TaxID=1328930 RepID=UPI001C27EBB5|nr:hypothetical protein [Desertibacillus haloalkaliphilus]MBU8907503.1 hypothetical protein [Desertibacillus haloalkaliphilus]